MLASSMVLFEKQNKKLLARRAGGEPREEYAANANAKNLDANASRRHSDPNHPAPNRRRSAAVVSNSPATRGNHGCTNPNGRRSKREQGWAAR